MFYGYGVGKSPKGVPLRLFTARKLCALRDDGRARIVQRQNNYCCFFITNYPIGNRFLSYLRSFPNDGWLFWWRVWCLTLG